MKFGDKLIKLRKQHGLSQEELAEKLNVSRQSVQNGKVIILILKQIRLFKYVIFLIVQWMI